MSQMNTQGVNVVNAAGDPAQNASTAGANQRAKAELAVREQELKLQQAKIKLEKYGIDTQTQNYAALNQSHEKIAGMDQQGAMQRQQAAQAHEMVMQEKHNQFMDQQWRRQLALDERRRSGKREAMKGIIAGMRRRNSALDAAAPEVAKAQAQLSAAEAVLKMDPSQTERMLKQAITTSSTLHEGATRGFAEGTLGARKGLQAALLAVAKDERFHQSIPGDKGRPPSSLGQSLVAGIMNPFGQGTVGNEVIPGTKTESPTEIAQKFLLAAASDALPHIANPQATGLVSQKFNEFIKAYTQMATGVVKNADGSVSDPPPGAAEAVKRAYDDLLHAQGPDGKPAVNQYALTSFVKRMAQASDALADHLTRTGVASDADKSLSDEVFGRDVDHKLYGTIVDRKDQREALVPALKTIAAMENGLEHVPGLDLASPDHISHFIEALTEAISTRKDPNEVMTRMALTMGPDEKEALQRFVQSQDYFNTMKKHLDADLSAKEAQKILAQYEGTREQILRDSEVDMKLEELAGLEKGDVPEEELIPKE